MNKYKSIVIVKIIILLFLAMPDKAIANEKVEKDLDSVQKMLKNQLAEEKKAKTQAKSVAGEVFKIRRSLVTAAKKIQNAEGRVSSLESKFNQLQRDEKEILTTIKERRKHISKLLGILQSMSLRPVEALIIQESDPVNALRSSLLLRDVIPLIAKETTDLQKKLAELKKLRENIRQQYVQVKNATKKLQNQRHEIKDLLGKKVALQSNLETKAKKSSKKAKELSKRAENLQDLILEIEKQKAKEMFEFSVDSYDLSGMKGKIPLPVKGKITKKYGETLQSGIISKGISLKARKNAQVVAPFDGTVVFSGPFRDYRDVLIIDHGKGYHTLLAGMGSNGTVVGQGLLAGEPVGNLPENDPTLYVEIRKKGNAINPSGWFSK